MIQREDAKQAQEHYLKTGHQVKEYWKIESWKFKRWYVCEECNIEF